MARIPNHAVEREGHLMFETLNFGVGEAGHKQTREKIGGFGV